jgi:hypothetical protein
VQADPVDLDRAHRAQELRERVAIGRRDAFVVAVAREVLRDQVDLAHARGAERARFGDDVVDPTAALRAAQLGNNAKRARPIAAFGDLDVRGVCGADTHARRFVVVDVRGRVGDLNHRQFFSRLRRRAEDFCDRRKIARAQDVIDLGDIFDEVAGVALREAAGDDELSLRRLLVLGHLEDRVDALFFGGVDERAGVDDDDVGIVRRVDQRVPGRFDLAEHELGIDLVLRATERDEVDLHASAAVCSGRRGLSIGVFGASRSCGPRAPKDVTDLRDYLRFFRPRERPGEHEDGLGGLHLLGPGRGLRAGDELRQQRGRVDARIEPA